MGKLAKLSNKRKEATARKAKAAADAAAAVAAAAASAAAEAVADAASCAAAAAVVPGAPSGSGLATTRNRVATRGSYAAAVANGPAVDGETTSVDAPTVASPSSGATKPSKNPKLSAAVTVPAAMADCTGDAILPPAPDLLTKELKKKNPKNPGNFAAAVGHGANDASVPSKPRYPSRGTGTKTSTGKGASCSPVAKVDTHPIIPTGKAPFAVVKLKEL